MPSVPLHCTHSEDKNSIGDAEITSLPNLNTRPMIVTFRARHRLFQSWSSDTPAMLLCRMSETGSTQYTKRLMFKITYDAGLGPGTSQKEPRACPGVTSLTLIYRQPAGSCAALRRQEVTGINKPTRTTDFLIHWTHPNKSFLNIIGHVLVKDKSVKDSSLPTIMTAKNVIQS